MSRGRSLCISLITCLLTKSLKLAEALSAMSKIFTINHERPELPLKDTLTELCRRLQADEQRNQQRQPQGQPQHAFNPALAQQQQQMQAQAQTPQAQFQAQGQFLSPVQAAHLNLPGANPMNSPAMMSNHNTPAMQTLALQQQQPNAMGAPAPPGSVPMAHQASYQGTNPSAAGTPAAGSATASPNVTGGGKRRRASGVNLGPGEDGIDGPQMNGIGAAGGAPAVAANTKGGVKQSPQVGGKRQKNNA